MCVHGGVHATYESACLDNAWSARCARQFVVLATATPIERFFFSRGSKYRWKKEICERAQGTDVPSLAAFSSTLDYVCNPSSMVLVATLFPEKWLRERYRRPDAI